jgi:amino acid permease
MSSSDSNNPQRRLNRTDRRLLIMLFIQVILLALLTIPSSIDKLYSTFTSNNDKSPFQVVIENEIYNLTLLLTYLANGIPFYIYTLSGGAIFRKAFFDLMRLTVRKLIRS